MTAIKEDRKDSLVPNPFIYHSENKGRLLSTVRLSHFYDHFYCKFQGEAMAVFHDEVEIEDFEYDEESETYFYPCPCGDQFQITKVKGLP